MPRYDYVLFDADNTLFDFDRAEHLALRNILEDFGLPVTEEVRQTYLTINRALWAACDRGETDRDTLMVERFRLLLAKLGRTGDPAAMNRRYLDRLGDYSHAIAGAEALCAALAERCTLAIVTNGITRTQRRRYEASRLKQYIPHLFISQELGLQKPQREYFERVLSALGVADRSRTVVVGDSLTADIQGAVNAGLDSIWYDPKGLPVPDTAAPTYTARTLEEVGRIILG